jgi:hypothetical protein
VLEFLRGLGLAGRRVQRKKTVLVLLTISLLVISTEAKAWLVPCDGSDLPRCQTACENAGGTIVTNPYDGSKWCKIPYRIGASSSDPNAATLAKGGFNLKKGIAAFPPPESKSDY